VSLWGVRIATLSGPKAESESPSAGQSEQPPELPLATATLFEARQIQSCACEAGPEKSHWHWSIPQRKVAFKHPSHSLTPLNGWKDAVHCWEQSLPKQFQSPRVPKSAMRPTPMWSKQCVMK